MRAHVDFDQGDRHTNPPGEVLEIFWRLSTSAADPVNLRHAVSAPPELVLYCVQEGYLSKTGTWAFPVLTEKGRELLRGWRTCHDCREEITETIHHCPARRGPAPYRSV